MQVEPDDGSRRTPGPQATPRPGPDATAGRRRWLGLLPLCLAGAAPRRVIAHHGFAGVHDFARPGYLAGRIEAIWIGQPHVRLRLRLDPDLKLPRDRERFRALEDAEARQMLGRLTLIGRRGTVDVVLHSRMSQPLANEPDMLPVGLWTEIIGYSRTTDDEYRHEIQGVLVRLADGRMLVASTRLGARARPST